MIEVFGTPFIVCGDWDQTETPAGKLRIILPPLGRVNGGGWHPTTQTALQALLNCIQPGMSYLDIGTGSGILAVAANLLGANSTATEIEPTALNIAQEVFKLNNVTVELVESTFLPERHFDVALISISSKFAHENLNQINASTVIIVEDDASITVVQK